MKTPRTKGRRKKESPFWAIEFFSIAPLFAGLVAELCRLNGSESFQIDFFSTWFFWGTILVLTSYLYDRHKAKAKTEALMEKRNARVEEAEQAV